MFGPTVGFAIQDRVTIPRVLFATFRLELISSLDVVGGIGQIDIKWGFDDPDADLSSHGIRFAVQRNGGGPQPEFRSQQVRPSPFVFTPLVSGNPLLVIPPHITVRALVPNAGSIWVWELMYAGIDVEHDQGVGAAGRPPRTAPPAPDTAPRWFSPFRRRLRARRRRKLLPRR